MRRWWLALLLGVIVGVAQADMYQGAGTGGTGGTCGALGGDVTGTCAASTVSKVGGSTTLPASFFPALTGDVTTTAGSLATTLATVTVPKGGTGATTITGLVLGNGASAMSAYGGTGTSAGNVIGALSASGAATFVPAGSTNITNVTGGVFLIPNKSSTGTTVNKIAKLDTTASPATAVIATTSDTTNVLGVVVSGAGTTGSATILGIGQAPCQFDNTSTVGDFVIVSTSVNGDCSDAGSATVLPSSVAVVGVVAESGTTASPRAVDFGTPEVAGTGGTGGKGVSVQVAGTATKSIANFNATTPAAQAGFLNGTFQSSASGNTTSASLEVPISGNSSTLASTTGTLTNGRCVQIDASGNFVQASAACGSGTGTLTGTLTSGRVPVASGATSLVDTSNFTFDTTNFRWKLLNLTTATDNTANMIFISGTMPASPSTLVVGHEEDYTGAGNAAQVPIAEQHQFLAGYTGAKRNFDAIFENLNAGTGTTLNLGSNGNTSSDMNFGSYTAAAGSTAGYNVGLQAEAQSSTTLDIGLFGVSSHADAGQHIGVLGTAGSSTQGTNLKNVAVYGTLGTALVTGINGSMAGFFDGGTLPDANSNIVYGQGTMPASPSNTAVGYKFNVTGAGSASQVEEGMVVSLLAGYTGSSLTMGLYTSNATLGTGTGLTLGSSNDPTANLAGYLNASGAGTGYKVGAYGAASGSSGANFGVYGKAANAVAGTNIGGLFNAANSTQGTNIKNAAVWATLGTTDPAAVASNTSVAVAADGAGSDAYRAYNSGTLMWTLDKNGHEVSAGTAPTATSCGTTTTTGSGSTDMAGTVVPSGTQTTCTVTFANAFANAPVCVVVDDTNVLAVKVAPATNNMVLTSLTSMGSDTISWICIGK